MPAAFPIVDVTSWEVVDSEVIGRNPKVWVREPGGSSDRQRDWLFKPVVITSTGHRQGEDWAEKIVSELGSLLGVPCAEVQLAVRGQERGSISRNVVPPGWNRVLGSVLLGAVAEGYESAVLDDQGRERPVPGRLGHNLANIAEALRDGDAPMGSLEVDAIGAFASYVVLDAWVANQDRHDQNWAVLRRTTASPERLRLAASYDHASSIGFNLTDSKRVAHLTQGGVLGFARRGRAHRFEHDPAGPPGGVATLVDFAHEALALTADRGRRQLDRLEAVHSSAVAAVVERIPGLSDPTARFILELLEVNRRRLLDER